jgi:hypothetical protein
LSAILAGVVEWPFNPNFPQTFSFPAFGTVEWLALAWWRDCKGGTTNIRDADKIRVGAKLNWQEIWFGIYQLNHPATHCRFLNRIHFADANAARSFGVEGWKGAPTEVSVISFPDTEHYSLTKPGEWVETILNADRFWWYDINAWALECVEKEFRILNPSGVHLAAYGIGADPNGAKAKQCEHFCRRFHAYQQARYRYHEHLLEKYCERALGSHASRTPAGYIPTTAAEARASVIGWLSKKRGYATNPLVKEFRRAIRAKNSTLSLKEKKAFRAERMYPSNRRYRITRSIPSRPDEMGWLILTWPVWNFSGWKWAHVAEALIKKFEFVDAKGEPLDFLKASRKRLQMALRAKLDENHSMPADDALALFAKYLFNPTPKEKELHADWERRVQSRRGEKAFEQLARLAIGDRLEKQILPRPKGRVTDKKPPLWDFAQQISA